MLKIHNSNTLSTVYCAGVFYEDFLNKSTKSTKSSGNSTQKPHYNYSKKAVRKVPDRAFDVYKIILHNDQTTPVHFVIKVIQIVFEKSPAESHGIMYEAHVHGKVIIGFFPKDIANAHIKNVHLLAQKHGYPLRCSKLLVC